MGGFVRNKTISGARAQSERNSSRSPEARETLRKIVEKIPRIASRSESALGFCRKPAFARRFVYRPLDVFVWWRGARQGAYAALWRRRKHFGIVPMRIEKSGEHRQAAGATHSAAVLVAAERDRTRGLNRR